MRVTMIEAGWLTYTSPSAVVRALEVAGRLRAVHKCSSDPRAWTVDAGEVATLPHVRLDRALWREMQRRDALQSDTSARLSAIERRLDRLARMRPSE